jgi:EpsI family protein
MGLKTVSLKAVILVVAMLSSYGVAKHFTPTTYLADTLPPLVLDKALPGEFGGWKVDPRSLAALVNPSTEAFLKTVYSETLSRTYINDAGDQVMLSIAYGREQTDGNSVHFPEVCYPAQGFKISDKYSDQLSAGSRRIAVTRLMTTRGPRSEPVTYWIAMGDQIIGNNTSGKIARLKYGFKGIIPDGLLFRVSTITEDPKQAWVVQDKFVRDLLSNVPAEVAIRLAGSNQDAPKTTTNN